LAGQFGGNADSRRQADDLLRQARKAIKEGDLVAADGFVSQAEKLGVKYDPLTARFVDTPDKLRKLLTEAKARPAASSTAQLPSSRFPSLMQLPGAKQQSDRAAHYHRGDECARPQERPCPLELDANRAYPRAAAEEPVDERHLADPVILEKAPRLLGTFGDPKAGPRNLGGLERPAIHQDVAADHERHDREEDRGQNENHRSIPSANSSDGSSTPATRSLSMKTGRTPVVSK
jgi:hypothetical protein